MKAGTPVKAWEMELELRRSACPRVLSEEEQTWEAINRLRESADQMIQLMWHSEVPGSGAPEKLMVAAVQSVENQGRNVSAVMPLLHEGLAAWSSGDTPSLHRLAARIMHELAHAPVDPSSPYWRFDAVRTWEQHEQRVSFPDPVAVETGSADFAERVHAGWLAQVIGGALGTALEGYTTANIKEVFGDIKGYVREPNTFNDDITYELAFLKAYEAHGRQVSSGDIAEQWLALIPFGWSAEHVALENLKLGVFPPDSGSRNNPYSEWIGAQMRGAVCGLVAPGDAREAARLAWLDGVISHESNGVLGETFNAILTALAFIRTDIRALVAETCALMPDNTEYRHVVAGALDACRRHNDWEPAWQECEKALAMHNWIHAYPNAAAEVVALWFGNGDFDETMRIIALAGQDVDCNAAQIATVLGVMKGPGCLSEAWTRPIGDRLVTYVRGMEEMSIAGLARWTVGLARKWR